MESKLKKKNKIGRPLTKSEKTLLTILGIILLFWSSNRFVLTPQASKLDELKAEDIALDEKIADNNRRLKMEDNIKKEWEILHRERNQVLSNFFPTLDQPQIIYVLNDLIPDKGINLNDMSFSRPSVEKIGEVDVNVMGVSIPFDGNFDAMMETIKSLETSTRRIVVDSLSLDRKDNSSLGGNMALNIYSLEGLAETDPNIIPIQTANSSGQGSLFDSFSGYSESSSGGGSSSSDGTGSGTTGGGNGGEGGVNIDGVKGQVLTEFDWNNFSFIPSNPNVSGATTLSTIKKSGKYSLRFEYNILAIEEENRAYIDMSDSNIEFKYPPNAISMWVNAFGYSPGTLGMRLRTQTGEDIDIELSEGISWIGWSNIQGNLPEDLKLYPLKISHIYFEVPYDRDDFGVLLFDKMEAYYPEVEDKTVKNTINDFYVVEKGDTASSISRKLYGTIQYKNEIMVNNGIKTGDILLVGKVLVVKRH